MDDEFYIYEYAMEKHKPELISLIEKIGSEVYPKHDDNLEGVAISVFGLILTQLYSMCIAIDKKKDIDILLKKLIKIKND